MQRDHIVYTYMKLRVLYIVTHSKYGENNLQRKIRYYLPISSNICQITLTKLNPYACMMADATNINTRINNLSI